MPTPKQHDSRADRQKAYRQRTEQARRDALAAKNLPATAPIPTMPSIARWQALHDQARAALDTMQAEMQGYFADRSEVWQEGEKGAAFQEVLDRVEEARAAVDDLSLD